MQGIYIIYINLLQLKCIYNRIKNIYLMRNFRKVHLVYLFTFDVQHTLKTEFTCFFCLLYDKTLISDVISGF